MTPPGIGPGTIRLVAQRLNHYATPSPYMYDKSRSILLKNASDNNWRENLNTRHMFNNFFFFFENRAIYEIVWKNCIEPNRPQMIITCGACTLHAGYLGTQIHTQVCFSSPTMDARKSLSVTLYVHCLFC